MQANKRKAPFLKQLIIWRHFYVIGPFHFFAAYESKLPKREIPLMLSLSWFFLGSEFAIYEKFSNEAAKKIGINWADV